MKEEKRVRSFTVKALIPKFIKKTGKNVPYATLFRSTPFWLIAPKLRDRETCLYIKHENFELKFNKLKNLHLNYESTEKLIEKKTNCVVTS